MKYGDCLNIIKTCIDHNILIEKNNKVYVYLSKSKTSSEGWYLLSKEDVATKLMNDEDGIELILKEFNSRGIIL